MSADHRRVVRLSSLRHIRIRALLQFEITVMVLSAHQRGPIMVTNDLTDIGREVANGESDSAMVGLVWLGAMDQPNMVERHFARFQRQRIGLTVVDLNYDLLPPAEEVLRTESIPMWYLRHGVRSWDDAHGAIFNCTVG